MFMALSLKEKNQDVINQAIRELQRAANVDTPSFTPVGDTNYSIQPTDSVINQVAGLTATRTWTFPLVSSVNPGQRIKFISVGCDVTATHNLILATQAPDNFYIEQTKLSQSTVTLNSIQNSFEAIAFNNSVGSTFWALNFDTDISWTNWIPNPGWFGVFTSTITTNFARYSQRGTTVNWAFEFSISAGGTVGTFILFTTPTGDASPRSGGGGGGRETAQTGKALGLQMVPGAGAATLNLGDVSAMNNSMVLLASGVYEVL